MIVSFNAFMCSYHTTLPCSRKPENDSHFLSPQPPFSIARTKSRVSFSRLQNASPLTKKGSVLTIDTFFIFAFRRERLRKRLSASRGKVLSAVFLGGLFPQHERGGGEFEPFQLHPPHSFLAAKPFLRVKDFQPGQPPFAVVIRRDALGQMFGRDRGFAERDAQCIHCGVA